MSTRDFYDDLADLYDVIYVDWEAACRRHAAAILEVVGEPAASRGAPLRVLDVSAGIGTQALPLAASGMEVTARDLSPGAIARLEHEATARGLEIDTGVCDMRSLDVDGPYDVVVSFDNSVPHLPDDDQILRAFREAHRVLAPDGRLVISVRDYAEVERGADAVHRYGERRRGERVFEARQEWVWLDPSHYRTTMIVDEGTGEGSTERVRTSSTCYAIEIPRLLDLMTEAGFSASVVHDVDFYQPVLTGRKSRSVGSAPSGSYEDVAEAFMAARSPTIGVAAIRAWAAELPRGGRILDLGCGHGEPVARALAEMGFAVHGVDASERLVAAFRANVPGATAEVGDAATVEVEPGGFDGVAAWGLLFLLDEAGQEGVIRTASRALGSGGRFIATAPWQTGAWQDVVTGRRCMSLGRERYAALFDAAGFDLVAEGGDDDEGGNHYWSAVKRGVPDRG